MIVPPTLVLLPGMDGTGELFSSFVRALGIRVKMQVIPYPPDQALGYAALGDFVRTALPRDAPYVLLGESFSGPVAIALAAAAPAHLMGLVLCCSFARNPHPVSAVADKLLGLMPFGWTPGFALSQLLLGPFATPSLLAAVVRAVTQVTPAVRRERVRAVLSVDVSAALASVKVPCLYLRATHDRAVPTSASTHIRSILPSVRMATFDAPHMLLQVVPERAAVVVESFLQDLTVGR